MRITVLLDLNLQIGNLRKSITFAFVDNPAVPLIVGTAYQDKYIESIHCKTRRLKSFNSRSVGILDAFDSAV